MLVLAMEFSRRTAKPDRSPYLPGTTEVARQKADDDDVRRVTRSKLRLPLPQNGTEILNQYINWESPVSTERLSVLPK